jgi:hypothetical protein
VPHATVIISRYVTNTPTRAMIRLATRLIRSMTKNAVTAPQRPPTQMTAPASSDITTDK